MHRLFAIGIGIAAYTAVVGAAHSMDSAQATGVTWNLHTAGTEAKLAYGAPNSDLVGIMMTCERGSGQVVVAGDVSVDRPLLVLASGRSKLKLRGEAEPDPYTGGLFMYAEADARAEALRRFERTGDLKLVQRIGARDMKASDEAKGDIREFFAHCTAKA